MPVLDSQTEMRLLGIPVELLPLYLPMLLLSNHAVGHPAAESVPSSYVLAQALRHLGYKAELLVCSARVFDEDLEPAVLEAATLPDTAPGSADVKITEVGEWDREPHFHGDRESLFSGHVIVWAESFRRWVDLTIGQDETLYRASGEDPVLTQPVVGYLTDSEVDMTQLGMLLAGPIPARRRVIVIYRLFPQYAHSLDPYWRDEVRLAELNRAALALAHDALDGLRVSERDDTRIPPGPARDLLDGRAQLPPFIREENR
jgi:hypothetical protein